MDIVEQEMTIILVYGTIPVEVDLGEILSIQKTILGIRGCTTFIICRRRLDLQQQQVHHHRRRRHHWFQKSSPKNPIIKTLLLVVLLFLLY